MGLPRLIWIVPITILIGGCRSEVREEQPFTTVNEPLANLFTKLPPENTGLDFINRVEDGELFNVLTYRNFYNGGGVAIGDINNDGLSDVYMTANMGPNKLYLNLGEMQFKDITVSAGVGGKMAWSTGVSMADVNGDGWLDIYVCSSGDVKGDSRENELFINNGDNTFNEKAFDYRLNDKGFTTHASFFDYDSDGDLDCYILNNSFKDPSKIELYTVSREEHDALGGDKLLRNEGDHFKDVTLEAGIYNSAIGFGLGVSTGDLNGDHYPDIYISNDFWERDYLYFNNGDGTFSEELNASISICPISSMGSDVGDLNNDGAMEIFTTDMLPGSNYRLKTMTYFEPFHLRDAKNKASFHYQILQNCLQLNNGYGAFQEVGHLSKVAATDWSWGALIFDFDNDGWKDIFVSNGLNREIMDLDFSDFISDKEEIKKVVLEKGRFEWSDFVQFLPSKPLANYAFVNNGKGQIPVFKDRANIMGLGSPSFSNGAAYGDLDNDGDLDLIVNNVNMPAFLYRNNSKNNFLRIRLEGSDQNPFGIGAEVKIKKGNHIQVLQNYTSRGFQSAVPSILNFGVGSDTVVDEIQVTWPNLTVETLHNVAVNQTLSVLQSNAKRPVAKEGSSGQPLFEECSKKVLIGVHGHSENNFNDFDHENLLPRMLSTEGPPLLKGDLNGDGKEDLVLGGGPGETDKLFLQEGNSWKSHELGWDSSSETDTTFETTCGAIFDADGDGDNDILLGSGGNELGKAAHSYLLRFYENKGSGEFQGNWDKAPKATGNFSCIKNSDMDGDGDQDLFIGARAIPGNYGLKPRSYVFRNEGNGQWTDITTREIGELGMITDAVWSDTDKDGDMDLWVSGEWLPITYFENTKGQLQKKILPGLESSQGWWSAIEAADLDGDGDEDYILGNWGLNSKFKASVEKPLTLYVKDFDNNGKSDFIFNWYPPLDEEAYPFASKMDLMAQLPHLKKHNLMYKEYAQKTYESLLTGEERQNAISLKAVNLASSIVWNDGGAVRIEALPLAAQVAPVFGILAEDLDLDGAMDLWLGGNFHGLKPEFGRLDSSRGTFLKGDGSGTFSALSHEKTGLGIGGQIRDVISLEMNDMRYLFMARNNLPLVCFKANGTVNPPLE